MENGSMRKAIATLLSSILMLGACMDADAGLFGLSDKSWKEEVLLHDGNKLVVKRSFGRGGMHEPGQRSSIKKQDLTFTLPGSQKTITWKSEYSKDVGRSNFNLLALHILKGIPYLVTEPNLCLSYNKWGRPNPPYVLFKYDGKTWQRIPLAELPAEFKELNVVITLDAKRLFDVIDQQTVISAETIKSLNRELTQQEYKTILREAYPGVGSGCEELIRYKGYWIMPNDPVARSMVDRKTK
jgi:hypothetical protein